MGTVFCSNCGTPAMEGGAFCMECGAPLNPDAPPSDSMAYPGFISAEPVPEPVPAGRVCSFCGFPAEDDSRFCSNCGNIIDEIPAAPTPVSPEEPAAVKPEPSVSAMPDGRVCSFCGFPAEDDSRFCSNCGNIIDEIPAAPTPVSPEEPAAVKPEPSVSAMPDGRVCSFCGFPAEDDSRFCSNCGNIIDEIPAAPTPVSPEEPAVVEPEPSVSAMPDGRICPACGSSVDEDSRFCSNCGRVFEEILVRCSNCNAIIAPGIRICAVCGNPVGGESPVSAPAVDSEPTLVAEPSAELIKDKERKAAERNFHKPPKL